VEFAPTNHEKQSLEAHVDLCAIRYEQLDSRLNKVENELQELRKEVQESGRNLKNTIITTSGTIIVAILGLIGTIVMLFADKIQ
jgi:hypothetical protein